ncbi:glycoside hydrolase superfamily [Scheffersomyces amazonensis]|uniref:glycoside hydrolase superfamily n=1 Tax=Scheffersomyces amazonensis TaxID=1078765 RepID=UPI00315D2BAC
MLPIKTLISSVLLISQAYAALDINASNNVAAYWGQNGAGGQERLSTYCAETDLDVVILSFLNDFPDPLNVNFANQCGNTFESGLLNCAQIGEDIQTCQSEGKTVLLSLGGQYGTYGFTSDQQAQDFATTLWNKFGAGSDPERPFGDAIVDGFDFDIEQGSSTGYTALAQSLRTLYASDDSKTYYLSASPQCPFPDQYVGDALSSADFDFAFIQFYNNNCAVGSNFNFDTWNSYAPTSGNPNLKLFVGIEAQQQNIADVQAAIAQIQCDSTFAGISIWDASGAWLNVDANGDNLVVQAKNLLNDEQCPSPSSSAAPSVVASSSFYGNSSVSTVTYSDISTTVVTITSCSDHVCTKKPVVTGYVVITDVNTIYTTYCPLSGEETPTSEAAVPSSSEVAIPTSSEAPVVVATKISSGVPSVAVETSSAPVVTVVPVVSTFTSGDITSYVTLNIYSTLYAGNGTTPEVPVYEGAAAATSFALAWALALPLAIVALL